MPKYLIEADYNAEGAKGLQSAGGTSRAEAVKSMVEALGGDAGALKAFAARNVAPDRARYPQ